MSIAISVTVGISKRSQAVLVLIHFLEERYSSFYNELYLNIIWLDPQYWQGRAKQWERQNITIDQLFRCSTCCSKF